MVTEEEQYKRYCFLNTQMEIAPGAIVSKSGFLMNSMAKREQAMHSLENRYRLMQQKANVSYEHWLRLQEHVLNSGRIGMSDPLMTETVWNSYTLAFKVAQIANLEKLLDLPSSEWSDDTPTTQTDVVAW